jgi:hypothetical protein
MLAKLSDGAPVTSEMETADPFMFQASYSEKSSEQIANILGQRFARSVLELKAGLWQGPVESGLGWHLVFVDSITPSRIPAFEEAEPTIRTDWTTEQRDKTKREMFETTSAHYQVLLPDNLIKETAGPDASLRPANQ